MLPDIINECIPIKTELVVNIYLFIEIKVDVCASKGWVCLAALKVTLGENSVEFSLIDLSM